MLKEKWLCILQHFNELYLVLDMGPLIKLGESILPEYRRQWTYICEEDLSITQYTTPIPNANKKTYPDLIKSVNYNWCIDLEL